MPCGYLYPAGIIQKMIGSRTLEIVQETLARLRYWRKTLLAGLAIILDSCFRDCANKRSFRHALHAETLAGLSVALGSCFRDCARNPTFVILNPPSPPYQGGIEWKVPLIRGI